MAQYLSFMDDMNVYTDDPIMQSPTTIISDMVKKSYEQQLLPIRQQSLPCHQHTVLPVRKSSISTNTRVVREPTASSIKQARRKISVRHRSSKSETSLVVVKGKSRKRRYSVDVGKKKNQEQQDLLLSYFYYPPSPIHTFDRACISVIMNRLLDSTQEAPQRLWHGSEIVDQLLTLLHTTYRPVAINVASALPFVQINGPPLDSISDSTELLYRLPIQPSRSQQQQRTPSSLFTELYQGVFVPLSKCYAPRCTRDQTCYSVSCPNKSVSPAKVPLPSSSSKAKATATHHQHALWIHSVPRTVVSGTHPSERYRQEAIYELIQTEIDFVGHLRYIKKFWIDPLKAKHGSIAQQIFWNWQDVMQVSTCLMEALVTRQQEDHRITHVADVLLAHVGQFEPFVIYGSHQLLAKVYLELEKKRNPWFAQFVKETEQRRESERLELNGYLTKVTTRLARYPILLAAILQWTPGHHPDHAWLVRVVECIKGFLRRLDHQVGQVSHRFELDKLSERLVWTKFVPQPLSLELDLKAPHRRLIHQGRMQRTSLDGDIHVFLFDHLLLFTKVKIQNHLEYYRPFGKWIPLASLTFAVHDQVLDVKKATTKDQPTLLHLIAFQHQGQGTPVTLVTPNEISRRNWVEKIIQSIDELHRPFSIA